MPPKRTTTESNTDSVSQSETRVTRSSKRVRETTTSAKDEAASPPAITSASRKTPTKRNKKAKTTPSEKPPTQNISPDPNASSKITTLTITSNQTKSPTQCNLYASLPSSSHQHLIFTHGAGGTLSAPAVTNFCTGFSTTLPVLAFQGSMNLAARVKGFHACIEHLAAQPTATSSSTANEKENGLLLAGRSMGARAAVMAVTEILAQESRPQGVSMKIILVSYPLQGPKDIRDQILLELPESVEVLFVIGERDGMCPLDMLGEVRKKMSATSQLVVVRGADHGMHVKPAKREREVGEETGRVAAQWVKGELEGDVVHVGDEEEV